MRRCSFEGCDRKHSAKGYCPTHYHRLLAWGTPEWISTSRREHQHAVLPAAPLRSWLRANGVAMRRIELLLPTAARQVYRCGRVSIFDADEIACALGVHPMDIWPDWFEVAA